MSEKSTTPAPEPPELEYVPDEQAQPTPTDPTAVVAPPVDGHEGRDYPAVILFDLSFKRVEPDGSTSFTTVHGTQRAMTIEEALDAVMRGAEYGKKKYGLKLLLSAPATVQPSGSFVSAPPPATSNAPKVPVNSPAGASIPGTVTTGGVVSDLLQTAEVEIVPPNDKGYCSVKFYEHAGDKRDAASLYAKPDYALKVMGKVSPDFTLSHFQAGCPRFPFPVSVQFEWKEKGTAKWRTVKAVMPR
jgi:hypothetical protein